MFQLFFRDLLCLQTFAPLQYSNWKYQLNVFVSFFSFFFGNASKESEMFVIFVKIFFVKVRRFPIFLGNWSRNYATFFRKLMSKSLEICSNLQQFLTFDINMIYLQHVPRCIQQLPDPDIAVFEWIWNFGIGPTILPYQIDVAEIPDHIIYFIIIFISFYIIY